MIRTVKQWLRDVPNVISHAVSTCRYVGRLLQVDGCGNLRPTNSATAVHLFRIFEGPKPDIQTSQIVFINFILLFLGAQRMSLLSQGAL